MKDFDEKPEEAYIRRGMAERWITKQTITMALITIDHRYQGRVLHLDMNHVRTLARIRDDNDAAYLNPIVVFLMPDGRFLLVDGFHRHEENRRRKETSVAINAYVVNRDAAWETDALLFASMCNQRTVLARSNDDKAKSIEMVLSIPDCESWTDSEVANHCGVSVPMVARVRKEYAVRHGKAMRIRPPRARKHQPALVLAPGAEVEPDQFAHPPLSSTRGFKDWALNQRVILETPEYHPAGYRLYGLMHGTTAIVLCNSVEIDEMYRAIGRALTLRQLQSAARCVVVAVEQEGTPQRKVWELARQFGVEFMTPHQLITEFSSGDGEHAE